MTKFIENKWTQLVLSLLSALFIVFNIWMTIVCINYAFAYNSLKLAYVIYAFINLIFGVLLFCTRKNIITIIITVCALPVSLILLVISIDTGNWLIAIPPLVINFFAFFALKTKYTTKVMLTTITAVLYVVCILAYVIFITLFGQFPFHNFSSSVRISETVSPDGNYRAVLYAKDNKSDILKRDIYIEFTNQDKSFGFVTLKHISDEFRIYSDKKNDELAISWNGNNKLKINNDEKTVNFDSKYDVTHIEDVESKNSNNTESIVSEN